MTKFPFELEVYIDTRPHLRDDSQEMEMYLGRRVLDSLFDRMEETDDQYLTLSYPERWLNILEQRQLFQRIEKYCPKMKEVKILTHSVYIIQCTPNTCCKLFVEDESIKDDGEGKLYSPPKVSFMGKGLNGLHVVGGSISDARSDKP